jgi:hypothetical protein
LIEVHVEGVELRGSGLAGWIASRPILAGTERYRTAAIEIPSIDILPPADRRRTVASVKLALGIGWAAMIQAGQNAAGLPAVFASSGADGETIHAILEALASTEREVSPTRFQNSVHNVPSGYWGIATQSREPVTSLSCHDASFAAGLLEAAVQAVTMGRPVALIAYDLPYPEPLHSIRPICSIFGVALILSPEATDHSLARLNIGLIDRRAAPVTPMADPMLEEIRGGNPAARSLPVLAAIAGGSRIPVVLDYVSTTAIAVTVRPVPHEPGARESAAPC